MDEPRFYEQAELDRIHKMELEILVDFMTICEKNHLHYFALAGTGIGAIRHVAFAVDDVDARRLRYTSPPRNVNRSLRPSGLSEGSMAGTSNGIVSEPEPSAASWAIAS